MTLNMFTSVWNLLDGITRPLRFVFVMQTSKFWESHFCFTQDVGPHQVSRTHMDLGLSGDLQPTRLQTPLVATKHRFCRRFCFFNSSLLLHHFFLLPSTFTPHNERLYLSTTTLTTNARWLSPSHHLVHHCPWPTFAFASFFLRWSNGLRKA
jgi:hypothetical protein